MMWEQIEEVPSNKNEWGFLSKKETSVTLQFSNSWNGVTDDGNQSCGDSGENSDSVWVNFYIAM